MVEIQNPRKRFEERLDSLDSALVDMSAAAGQMLAKALAALEARDQKLAQESIQMDDIIDAHNLAIETSCLELIATQQPTAKDLRRIISAIKIAGDVERVGDYGVDIAKAAASLADKPLFKPLVDIPKLQRLVQRMLEETIQAFVTRDLALVQKMIDDDAEVDHLYRYLYDELADFMRRDPELVDQALKLLFIARYLERIADHVTNIGERVYYVETGELKELHD